MGRGRRSKRPQLISSPLSLSLRHRRFISVPPSLGDDYLQNHDSHAIVESIDLFPTLADLSGLEMPPEVRYGW